MRRETGTVEILCEIGILFENIPILFIRITHKIRKDMSMVFKFRMLSDENDHFVRDYEVPYDMTLLGFHEFITRSLGYEEGMVSFFTADKQWNRLREFTLMDMGDNSEDAPLPMADITLGQLIHNNRDRLIYQFDLMGDRAYYLELTEAKKPEQGMEYPRVAFEHAPAPDQFDPDASESEGSIFEEMMGDFSSFEGDDNYSDDD